MSETPERAKLLVLAERIVDRLFRTGFGDVADRIELKRVMQRREFGLGGWGRQPAIDQVADVLAASSAPAEPWPMPPTFHPMTCGNDECRAATNGAPVHVLADRQLCPRCGWTVPLPWAQPTPAPAPRVEPPTCATCRQAYIDGFVKAASVWGRGLDPHGRQLAAESEADKWVALHEPKEA